MPNIRSATKKARQDKKQTARNDSYRKSIKRLYASLTKAKSVTKNDVKKAYSLVDKAEKKKIIHKHKAARMKSWISKLTPKNK